MIGVSAGAGGLEIWGVVQTGAGWLQAIQGSRARGAGMPQAVSVAVSGPGRVLVSHGDVTIAKLVGGTVAGRSPDVFESRWLPDACAEARREVVAARGAGPGVDPDLLRKIDQQLIRRILADVQLARHGGTIVLLPEPQAQRVARTNLPIALKYRFVDEEARRRYRSLQLRLLDLFTEDAERHGRAPTWESYRGTADPRVAALDDALRELAHTIAGFADVDGAVVMSKRFEVMGFGARSSATCPTSAS